MIGYNNQGIKLLPHNALIPFYDKKYTVIHHTKPEVNRAWLALFSAAWAIFGPPGIFK